MNLTKVVETRWNKSVAECSNEELYNVDDVQGTFDSEKKEATFKIASPVSFLPDI